MVAASSQLVDIMSDVNLT